MIASPTYLLFRRAMAEKKPIACLYDSYPRALCPIILGHTDREEVSLAYQFAGESGSGRVRGWKCLTLSNVADARLFDGPWNEGPGPHSSTQSCVKDVDCDVNAESPYNPKRRLP